MSVFGKLQSSNGRCGCGFLHPAFICVAQEKQERSIWSRSHLVHWTLCAISAVLAYLEICSPAPGPFVFEDGRVLSRQQLVTELSTAIGLDPSPYKGHSFHIGTATAAAKAGLSDSLIQTLGRWKSSEFKLYVRTSKEQICRVTSCLVP